MGERETGSFRRNKLRKNAGGMILAILESMHVDSVLPHCV
jgi:hypothetical protein